MACFGFGVSAPTELMAVGLAGAVGGILPDVDSKGSKASKASDKFLAATVIGAVACIAAGKTPVSWVSLVPLMMVVALLMFGRKQPHRGATHSVLYGVAFSVAVALANRALVIPFAAGFASHLVIDLLNTKGESLLWPLEGKWCFKVCKSNGFVNTALGALGAIVAIAVVAVKLV